MKVIELTSFACMYLCTSSNRSYNMIHLAQDQQGIKCDHICCPYEINRSCSWDTYFIYQFYFALSHSWLVLYLGIVFVRCLNVWLSTTKPPFCIKISSESKVCISTNRCKYLSSPPCTVSCVIKRTTKNKQTNKPVACFAIHPHKWKPDAIYHHTCTVYIISFVLISVFRVCAAQTVAYTSHLYSSVFLQPPRESAWYEEIQYD